MLERYRSENNKIVEQKDQQIHSLQSSLSEASKTKVVSVCVCVCVCV